MAAVEAYEDGLRADIEAGLAQLPGVTLWSRAAHRTPTLLLTFDGRNAADAYRSWPSAGVNAPAGSFYAIEPSRWLGLGDAGGLRVGLAPYSDADDVERLLTGLREFLAPTLRACRRRAPSRPGAGAADHRAHLARRGREPLVVGWPRCPGCAPVVVGRLADDLGGMPPTTDRGGSLPWVTTAPAATIEPEPMCAPFITMLPMPTSTSSSTRAPCRTTLCPTVTPRPMSSGSRRRSAACSRPACSSPRRSRYVSCRRGRPRRTRCCGSAPSSPRPRRPPSAPRRPRRRSWGHRRAVLRCSCRSTPSSSFPRLAAVWQSRR